MTDAERIEALEKHVAELEAMLQPHMFEYEGMFDEHGFSTIHTICTKCGQSRLAPAHNARTYHGVVLPKAPNELLGNPDYTDVVIYPPGYIPLTSTTEETR